MECHSDGVRTAGQCEIGTRFDTLVNKADELLTLKYVVHNVAHAVGKTATFMPKPFDDFNRNAFHIHISMQDIDGKNLKRVTHGETFDAFPVFSNDGKKLIFSSNRNNGGGHDTNLFIAEWQD